MARMRIAVFTSLLLILLSACAAPPKADLVVVEKSKNKLHLIQKGQTLKSYDISLGKNPVGHKIMRGDMRTPEGRYLLDYKNENSKFYRSINISYPNEYDIARAHAFGMDPGDDIVIHGMPNHMGDVRGPIYPINWTEGCIAVRNHEMDEIWELVELNTPIEIRP
jgi:murein L,D-transpeptidase YafK